MASLDLVTFEAIVELLCPQCTPAHDLYSSRCLSAHCVPSCQGRDEDFRRVRALASLCLASRRVGTLATPHLYHHPTCAQWPLLARTLVVRPDLARHVKHLCNCDWIPVHTALSDPAFPREVMARWDRQGDHDDSLENDADGDSDSENAALDLLLPLCPEVEELNAVLDFEAAFTALSPESTPLPRLTTVAITHRDAEPPLSFLDVGALTHLALAAPNIRRVVARKAGPCHGHPPLRGVTHLRLPSSSMSPASLRSALRACPRLESLEYRTSADAGRGRATPLEAQGVLIEAAPRLRSLVLDLDEAWSEQVVLGEMWVMTSLRELGQLRRLGVDTRCVVPHEGPAELVRMWGRWRSVHSGPIPEVGEGALVELLPESIREVVISRGKYGPRFEKIGGALAGLAVGARQLKELRRVAIEGKGAEGMEGLRALFEDQGIEFVARGARRGEFVVDLGE